MKILDKIDCREQDLAASLQKGDKEAFAAIFKLYWKQLYSQAYNKVRSHEVAEEIVQEVFLLLWEKHESLFLTDLEPYLRVVLRNKCIDHIRNKLVKDKYWNYYKTFIPQHADSTEEIVSYNNLTEALEKGMAALPEKTKKIFALSRIEGKTIADVAKDFNLSEKAVEYHLTKSLKALKVYLKDFVLLFLIYLS